MWCNFSTNSHFDAPDEWPPVDFMQGAVINIRGQTVSPMLLVVRDQMLGTSHLNENEYHVNTSFGKHIRRRYFEHR